MLFQTLTIGALGSRMLQRISKLVDSMPQDLKLKLLPTVKCVLCSADMVRQVAELPCSECTTRSVSIPATAYLTFYFWEIIECYYRTLFEGETAQ